MPDAPDREEWGWTSYRRTGWVRDDGVREYRATLQTVGSLHHWTRCTIMFSARHPLLALRQIVAGRKSAEEILAFAGQTIN
jgi:hypothetical protein